MVLDVHVETCGEAVDCALEAGVVECDELAASVAEQVVVMVAVGVDALEAGVSLVDREALDEAVLDEQVEHAVDTRAADRLSLGAQRVLDLDCGERARLAGEQVDDPRPRAAALVAGAGKDALRVLAPALGALARFGGVRFCHSHRV